MARRRPGYLAKRKATEDDGQDAWLITYADLITQLMCFFVILAMVAKPEAGKLHDVAKAFASGFVPNIVETPYAGMRAATETWIASEGIAVQASVDYSDRGVTIDMAGDALFGAGSATPSAQTVKQIQSFAATLDREKLPWARTRLVVEGYSDDGSTKGTPFASAWELSAARAAAIARLLTDATVPAEKIQIQAYGASRPIVPNRDASGQPIPANQARNRRVVIRVERGE